jgi:hypothetical protein
MKSKFDELLESRISNFEDETKEYIIEEGFFGNLGRGILNYFKQKAKNIASGIKGQFKDALGISDNKDDVETSEESNDKIVEGLSNFLSDREASKKIINIEYTPKKGTPVQIGAVTINIAKANDILAKIESGRYDLKYIKNVMLLSNKKPLANVQDDLIVSLVNTPYKDIIRTFRTDIMKKYFPEFKDSSKELIKEFQNYLGSTRPTTQRDIIIKILLVFMFSNTNFTLKLKAR